MISMEDRARELINPLDLGCEALRDKIVKIFIQALTEQERITKQTSCDEINILRMQGKLFNEYYVCEAIMSVNTEKGDG